MLKSICQTRIEYKELHHNHTWRWNLFSVENVSGVWFKALGGGALGMGHKLCSHDQYIVAWMGTFSIAIKLFF